MNIYRFRFFLRKKNWGKSYKIIEKIKKISDFRRSRLDVYIPKKNSHKLVICLGQMHPVLRGKISRFAAKRIGKTQARLFTYYHSLFSHFQINTFGEEGVTCDMQQGYFRYDLELLKKKLNSDELGFFQNHVSFSRVRSVLVRLALEWCHTLKNYPRSPEKVGPSASLVSGARLYSLENKIVYFFAIEGESAYQFTLKHISRLQTEIHLLENDCCFRKAKAKRFKNLIPEELQKLKYYNQKVQTFNNILKSPLRDEATLNMCVDHLKKIDVLSYTMGVGHRNKYLSLTNKMFKNENISFVMITPPEIWFWQFVMECLKYAVLLAILAGLIVAYWLL